MSTHELDATADPTITLPASEDPASQSLPGDGGSTSVVYSGSTKLTIMRKAPRAPPPMPVRTLPELVFEEDLPDGPVFGLTPANMANTHIGPVFFAPPAVYANRGVLHEVQSVPGQRRTVQAIWDVLCYVVRSVRFPDPDSLDENGRPRLRPTVTPSQVWIEPQVWARKVFLVGWLLHNPADNDTRWFYRNPDLPCLESWVPESMAMPIP